jgi:hypothetical protein
MAPEPRCLTRRSDAGPWWASEPSGDEYTPIGVLRFEHTGGKMSRPLAVGQETRLGGCTRRSNSNSYTCSRSVKAGDSEMTPSPMVAAPPGQPAVADRRLALLTCVSSDPTASSKSDRR